MWRVPLVALIKAENINQMRVKKWARSNLLRQNAHYILETAGIAVVSLSPVLATPFAPGFAFRLCARNGKP